MHPGRDKMQQDVEWRFKFSPGYYAILDKYCSDCAVCRATKSPNHSAAGNPVYTAIPEAPMRSVAMDVFAMPEVTVEGETYDCVILAVHRHSGYIVAVPGKRSKKNDKKDKHGVGLQAKTVANAMIRHWLTIFDVPAVICSDPGSQFVGTHFLSGYFFSIDPQHFVDGSTSSPGYSVIGENPGLFKFWSLSRSFQIISSIPESKSTLATFQLKPSRLFVHPEDTMNFTLFGSSKAADDGLSTLFNYSPSNLFQKHQASNSPLQTRFPSRQFEAVEGKVFDTRQRIFVPEVYRRLQDYSEFYLDAEGTDIQSAFVGSNSTEILDRGRVSSVAHNNYNELEKLLFKHKRFYLKPYLSPNTCQQTASCLLSYRMDGSQQRFHQPRPSQRKFLHHTATSH